MLFKKLKLLVNRKQVFCLSKIILVFLLLLINIATSIQARDSSKKLKDYISQQIQSSQKQKKNIYSILESLEGGIKKSNLLINSIESEIIIIEEDIQKKKASLALVQLELDKILEQVYQKFFLTYLLEKIKLSSFLPNLDYFKNYPRNKKIITLLLTEEILITEELFQKAESRKQQLQKLQIANNRLQQKKEQIKITTQKFLFEKKQYRLFLEEIEKEQQKGLSLNCCKKTFVFVLFVSKVNSST